MIDWHIVRLSCLRFIVKVDVGLLHKSVQSSDISLFHIVHGNGRE